MESSTGRFVVTFNGEIYNFEALRSILDQAGAGTAVRSDTAVLLAAIEHWGVRSTLARLVGMFAFAVWDRQERVLTLVRDRLGKKPLYYVLSGGGMAFSSELRALREVPSLDWIVDPDALAGYFSRGFVSGDRAIIRGVRKVLPGNIVQMKFSGGRIVQHASDVYWSPRHYPRSSNGESVYAEAVEQLDDLLRQAVADRIVADVSLGAFLSGGVDSSVVVAVMQAVAHDPVRTFTIGYEDKQFDESRFARDVARFLGTTHTEVTVTDKEARDIVPRLGTMFDEPFADSSQIPTFLISHLARKNVTVALSGDGGDELFCGYSRYFRAAQLLRTIKRLPPIARQLGRAGLRALPDALWNTIGSVMPGIFGRAPGTVRASQQARKLADALSMNDLDDMYSYLLQHWPPGSCPVNDERAAVVQSRPEVRAAAREPFDQMMRRDLEEYLPDDILVKVDRASMAVSLEVRAPLLDHRIVEFALQLPMGAMVQDGRGKRILRDVLDRYVPRELIDRPKVGFGVPLDTWLRTGLRDWAEDLLSESALEESGYLRAAPVRELWDAHQSGTSRNGTLLWDVLMFQAWRRAQTPQ